MQPWVFITLVGVLVAIAARFIIGPRDRSFGNAVAIIILVLTFITVIIFEAGARR